VVQVQRLEQQQAEQLTRVVVVAVLVTWLTLELVVTVAQDLLHFDTQTHLTNYPL
jgi:hypothetical protein